MASANPTQAFFSALGYNRQKGMLGGPIWISQVLFLVSDRLFWSCFQQVEALGLGAIRIELKVANPVGIIYECYIMAEENYFSDQAVVSFRILYEKDLERISLDVVDIPGRSSLSNYLQLLEIF